MSGEEEQRAAPAPKAVLGYHGCCRETAEAILRGDALLASGNAEDWLGFGIYFWEYAPFRALEWSTARFPEQTAVLEAKIELGDCLNLLDREHFAELARVYAATVSELQSVGIPIPRNTARGVNLETELFVK